MLSTTNEQSCFSWLKSSAKPSYHQNRKLIHPAGLIVVFLLHICTEPLYFVENFCLKAFSQHLKCLPLKSQYIQQKTSKYACHQGLGDFTSFIVVNIVSGSAGIHIDQRHISNMGGWMKSNTSLSSKLGVKVVIFWNFKTILEQFQKMKVVVLTPPNGQYCFC